MSGDTAPRVADPAPGGWARGLKARSVSALLLVAIAVPALLAGPFVFGMFVCVGAVILAWEWSRLCGDGRFGATGLVVAASALGAAYAATRGLEWLAVGVVALGAVAAFVTARGSGRASPLWLAAGPIYIGLPAIALIWLRGHGADGERVIVWLMLTVWATDIGAFFAGRLIGGPRIAPALSPNKTWAGLAGGVTAAIAVGLAVAAIDRLAPGPGALAVGGALLAVIAQAGDFAESAVKRRFGAKDSSQLIPGHGGLFDRVDGLIAAGGALALFQWASGGASLAWR